MMMENRNLEMKESKLARSQMERTHKGKSQKNSLNMKKSKTATSKSVKEKIRLSEIGKSKVENLKQRRALKTKGDFYETIKILFIKYETSK